jgi:di/tricarboxylate transporter
MNGFPSPHAAAVLALTGVTFWMFSRAKVRIELTGLILIAVLALGFYFFPLQRGDRFIGFEIAFGGFGDQALIAICSLMILGRGLSVTGALEPVARGILRVWRFTRSGGLLLTLVTCGAFSMFVNDTPVLVLVLPMLLNLAARLNEPASRTLMPVNYAILIGGMATTIGTSTNILVVSIARDLGVSQFRIFQFTDIVLIAAAAALPYVWLIMPRLLPDHREANLAAQRTYSAILHVTDTSAILGITLEDLAKKPGIDTAIRGIVHEESSYTAAQGAEIKAGDLIFISGTLTQIRHASEETKTLLARPSVVDAVRARSMDHHEDEVLAEVVVGAGSSLIGGSVSSAEIADRFGLAVVGTHYAHTLSDRTPRHPTKNVLRAGDMLLVQGPRASLREIEQNAGVMALAGAVDMPRTSKALLALAIMIAVVVVAAMQLVPIAVSALAGAIAMFATGCVRFDRIGRALSAEVIVLVAASIALGRALVETGAAGWIGGILAYALQPLPAGAAIAVMMAFVALLTNFASNTAAAAVGTPIAVSLASQLHMDAEAFVLAVLFGANLCFVTPMAYQTNLIIMMPGGYKFNDYVRAGFPLAAIMIAALTFLLVQRYAL